MVGLLSSKSLISFGPSIQSQQKGGYSCFFKQKGVSAKRQFRWLGGDAICCSSVKLVVCYPFPASSPVFAPLLLLLIFGLFLFSLRSFLSCSPPVQYGFHCSETNVPKEDGAHTIYSLPTRGAHTPCSLEGQWKQTCPLMLNSLFFSFTIQKP